MRYFQSFVPFICVLYLVYPALGQQKTILSQDFESTGKKENFISVKIEGTNSNFDAFHLFLPNSAQNANVSRPVIIFLQGEVGIGNEINAVLKQGLPKMLNSSTTISPYHENLMKKSFIYVIPHITEGNYYDYPDALTQIIDEVSENYRIDRTRIYLTGIGAGAQGVWGLASILQGYFTAIVPISGPGGGISNFGAFKDLPIWYAHNEMDEVYNFLDTRDLIEYLEITNSRVSFKNSQASGTDIKQKFIVTQSKNKGHDAWTEVYSSIEFYRWLLKQRKAK